MEKFDVIKETSTNEVTIFLKDMFIKSEIREINVWLSI